MKNLQIIVAIMIVLTISGCGVKGDPIVPAAPVSAP